MLGVTCVIGSQIITQGPITIFSKTNLFIGTIVIVRVTKKLFQNFFCSSNKTRVDRFVGPILWPKHRILEGWEWCDRSTRGHTRDPERHPFAGVGTLPAPGNPFPIGSHPLTRPRKCIYRDRSPPPPAGPTNAFPRPGQRVI